MNFIEELDRTIQNQNRNMQKEIDDHIPEIKLAQIYIELVKRKIESKMVNKQQRFLRGFPYNDRDCLWQFHEVASRREAQSLVSNQYYTSMGKLNGAYMWPNDTDFYRKYVNYTINVPYFEKKLHTELISLGCKVNNAEVLSGIYTAQRQREKKTLFGFRTITESHEYESFVIYIDIEW